MCVSGSRTCGFPVPRWLPYLYATVGFDVKKQKLYSELSSDVEAHHPISKAELVLDAYLESCSYSLKPNLMTIAEGWDIDWYIVNPGF